MNQTDQREYPRTAIEAPMQYAVLDELHTNRFHCTRMLNYSAAGLCYEIHQALDTHTEVCVVLDDSVPGQTSDVGCSAYLTLIQWIRPVSTPSRNRFTAGAGIIDRNYNIVTAYGKELMRTCDLCGAWKSVCQLNCQDQRLQLCDQCDPHYQSIPAGPLLRSLERFLMGNVL